MKSTGIIRKVDELGRVVIPIELRRNLNIDIKDGLEIYTEEDMIILKKHEPGCIFCGEIRDVEIFHDRAVCQKCRQELKDE